MYHVRNKGSHYAIGFKWGKRLKKYQIDLLAQVPFPIEKRHLCFAQACVPYYQKSFPAILEEIRGISDGNGCSYEKLLGVLLSMYCIMPATHCSCFAVRNAHGTIFGRNSDFLTDLEPLYLNTIYHFDHGSYAFEGHTTAFVEMEDGINVHGLMVGLTSVYPKRIQPGLNAGMLLRLFLETCKSIDEVIALLSNVTIASAQTFTLVDASKNIACIECCADHIHIYKPEGNDVYVCATNTFHSKEMRNACGVIEDDWQAKERFDTMQHMLEQSKSTMNDEMAIALLSGKHGFLCQYDRALGRDTVWSVLYHVEKRSLYRVEGNPSRKAFRRDERFINMK